MLIRNKYELYSAVGGDKQQRLNIPTLGFPRDDPQCVGLPGPSSENPCNFDNLEFSIVIVIGTTIVT